MIDLKLYIHKKLTPYKWEWLDRPAVDRYLAEFGFIVEVPKMGKDFSCYKGEYHIWLCNKGWVVARLDSGLDKYCDHVYFGHGFKNLEKALEIVVNL